MDDTQIQREKIGTNIIPGHLPVKICRLIATVKHSDKRKERHNNTRSSASIDAIAVAEDEALVASSHAEGREKVEGTLPKSSPRLLSGQTRAVDN